MLQLEQESQRKALIQSDLKSLQQEHAKSKSLEKKLNKVSEVTKFSGVTKQ